MQQSKTKLLFYVAFVLLCADRMIMGQSSNKIDRGNHEKEYSDIDIISSQILSCPPWDEIEKGYIKKVESKILKDLSIIAENDIDKIRQALVYLFKKYPRNTALWSRVFLLNRYIFLVPEQSPVDDKLFGGWVGTPVKNDMVNRLWPFSYDSQGKLMLVGEFEGYLGPPYLGLYEFDYFRKKYSLRTK